jgi:hypothetical protein
MERKKMARKKEIPSWSIKNQTPYKISRVLWILQIVIALLASVGLVIFIVKS